MTSDSTAELWESWSPDSKRLLYTHVNADHASDIYEMNADGSSKHLAPNGVGRGGYASWSPDGRFVLFERKVDSVQQVFVMDADGSHERRVTHTPWSAESPRWSFDGNADGSGERLFRKTVSYAVFSRDGKRMVFLSGEVGAPGGCAAARVYVADADGTNPQRVTLPIDP